MIEKQQGFTLIELMIVIGIIAVLSSIGLPTYQKYIQKAALTDMLQAMVPYKTEVELCIIEKGTIAACNAGNHSISTSNSSRYVSNINVKAGVITLTGKENLDGLTVTLTPTLDADNGHLNWQRDCSGGSKTSLTDACNEVFRFDNVTGSS